MAIPHHTASLVTCTPDLLCTPTSAISHARVFFITPCNFVQCWSVGADCVRHTCGRRMILGSALSRILLNPIFLAHTSLKEHALTQTPPDLKLDPTMTLTMPHSKISTRRKRSATKRLLAGLLGAWLATHTLSAIGDSEGVSEKSLRRLH